MQYTTNYGLTKLELSDSPADITEINDNWDTIDEKLKDHTDMLDGTTGSIAFTDKENIFSKIQNFLKAFNFKDTGSEFGVTPTSNRFIRSNFYDKNNVPFAYIQMARRTSGRRDLALCLIKEDGDAQNSGSIELIETDDGKVFGLAPTPEDTSDTNQIATTEWVRERIPELAPEPDLSDYVKSVNNVTPDASGNVNIEIPDFVPSGTKMLFYETAAPTGWTIDTSVNDVGVRIVSSNGGGVSGSTAFSSIFGTTVNTSSTIVTISGNTGNKALSVAMLAAHTHTFRGKGTRPNSDSNGALTPDDVTGDTGSTGSGSVHNHSFSGSSSHSHNITLNLKYIDVIVCTKD